jgi:hypothetical protein
VILRVDASGPYTLSSPFAVTWVGRGAWTSLSLVANAVNVLDYRRDGTTVYGAIIENGGLELDPWTLSFQANGTKSVLIARAEDIDVANASTYGTGTVTYAQNGVDISSETDPVAFAAGDRLGITVSGLSGEVLVSVPRFLP